MRPLTCPSEQQLHAFQLGDLPEPTLTEVAEHLEGCPRCETRSQQLDTELDPIMVALRAPSDVVARKPTQCLGPLLPPTIPRPAPDVASTAAFAFLFPPAQPDEIGRLGNYRVLRLLGKGGMAYVFHAEDIALRRPVALKVMKPDLDGNAEGPQRFLREARIMAAIQHEHLVGVFQAGQEGQVVYLAMELLAGESLAAWMKRTGPAAVADILRLGREIASGLAVVHGRGLIHRDIKPDNIWLEAPTARVKILDFGLARFVQDDARLTQSGIVMGTPAFMSPEQARGASVQATSDLFSLGCVLYALCTGKAPFDAENTMAALTALAVDIARPVHESNPAIPKALSDLVMQLLAKDPAQRPASAQVVLQRLAQIATAPADPSGLANPTSVVTLKPQASARFTARRMLVALAGLAVAVIAYLVFLVLRPRSALETAVAVGQTPASPSASGPPVYPTVPGATYLSDMQEMEPVNWPFRGQVPGPPPRSEPADWPPPKGGRRVIIRGKFSLHGIWTHRSPSGGPVSLSYDLGKRFRTFHATVSLNDGPPECSPLTFAVYGDGRLLWRSKPVSSPADVYPCTVSVQGVAKLKVEVDGSGDERGTHGVWIEPYVAK